MQTFLTTIINSRKLTQQLKNSKKIKKRHKVGKKGKLKGKVIFFPFFFPWGLRLRPKGGEPWGLRLRPKGEIVRNQKIFVKSLIWAWFTVFLCFLPKKLY